MATKPSARPDGSGDAKTNAELSGERSNKDATGRRWRLPADKLENTVGNLNRMSTVRTKRSPD